MKRYQSILLWVVVLLAIALSFSGILVHLLTESWWFDTVGFADVFWTRLTWQVLVWGVTLVVYGAFLWGNYRLALWLTRDRPLQVLERSGFGNSAESALNGIALIVIGVIALSAATASLLEWETVLKYWHASPFGVTDPIFERDISFYFFSLPFYESLQGWLLAPLGWGLVIAVIIYSLKEEIALGRNRLRRLPLGGAKVHLSLLLAAIAILLAVGFWLKRYELLYSPEGVVFGAGYTDVHARLPAYGLMSFVTLTLAVLFTLAIWRRGIVLVTTGIVLYAVVLVLAGGVYPWFQQRFIVEPNELEKERPYIAHNLDLTRNAYHLDQVQRDDYPASNQLDRQALQENQATVRNIRLWDYRPLLRTYRQIQEIRLYYRFRDVDIDRYSLDGNYRQVMLAARELAYSQVPAEAQTWVNQRLKYTHGYGLVMSPVNVVTPQGLPELFIKDIPPVSEVDLEVEEPAVYYGEETDNYIFTGTTTEEFDYPRGGGNAFTRYRGEGGVPLSSIWRRLAYAYDLNSLKLLISNYFTLESRIHYYRQIQERVEHVAPFLRFDHDPYLTVIDGKLQWVLDAYTVSDRYPYSEPVIQSNNAAAILRGDGVFPIVRDNINYIRNSVKVLVDAYNGTMRFFVVDTTDPVLATYRRIFPALFEPSEAVPQAVNAHFRYPLDFFKIQAQMYLSYHMDNPEVFYNREDLWRFPEEIYEGREQLMEPYYVIMRLPEADREEFALILPFTPVNKDNMIAWMAARSDGEHYGKLLLYEFPKQELVYGPSQVEARVDQNPEISQQLTLWSQEGSRVIRGDLLVIPINQSLLYVEPVYLRAEQGELPELKRVIVAYANQTVMAATLEQALAEIFGEEAPQQQVVSPVAGVSELQETRDTSALVQRALDTYQRAQEALRQGDWTRYGEQQKELGNLLQQLNQMN